MTEEFDIQYLLGVIYDHVNAYAGSDDPDDLAELLIVLSEAKSEISEMFEMTKMRLADLMGNEDLYNFEGVTFEKKYSTPRKTWDHKALTNVVSTRLIDMSVDMDTGEVIRTPQEMLAELVKYTGISYWKVKELEKIGINANNYCETGDAKANIIIRK